MTFKSTGLALSLILLGGAGAAYAGPDPVVRMSVAACDPSNPQNCIKPNADGSLNTKGGGTGGGGSVYGPTPVGTASSNPPIFTGFVDANGNVAGVTPSTPLPVKQAAPQNDVRGTTTLSAANGQFFDIPLQSAGTVGLRFSGLAASGAIVSFFISNDPAQTPVDTISALNAATGVSSPTRTVDGSARIGVSGHATLRVQVTTGGTGSIALSYNVSTSAGVVDLRSPLPPGANAIGSVSQGTAGISPWLQNLTQWAGVALGAPSTFATTPPTGNAPGVNAANFGVYNVTPPTLSNGGVGAMQLDAVGNLKIVSSGGLVGLLQGGAVLSPTNLLPVANYPSTGATLTTSQPAISTTAAALTFSGTVHREIENTGTVPIYIGASGVTTATGFPIPAGTSYDVSRFSGSVFAIAASATTAALISY